ncbi:glycosyltransferase family 29 protein, partial [Rosenbergiella australiborealis]|uniref:glycosyltransferase family 29 protein n=1 Tax=Rosenbergiella australiborealis TaxID=1544696 RepID=UPI001F4DC7B5
SVAIVGNGPSEIGKGIGYIIDSYDVVVRFNNYQIDNFSKDYGSKTNVWIRGSGGDDIMLRDDFSKYDLIILEADYEHFPIHFNDLDLIEKYIELLSTNCCNFDYNTHIELRRVSGLDFPTTGLVAIWSILNIVGKENIGLFGFSFLEEKPSSINNHYFHDRSFEESQKRTSVHDMEKESEFLNTIFNKKPAN